MLPPRAFLLTGNLETEIAELEWAWLERSEITNGGLGIVVPDSKGGGKTTTPMTKASRDVLATVDRVDGNPFVFSSQRKAGAGVNANHDQWTAILAEAKVENFRIHDLRHAFATWAISYTGLSKDEVGSLLDNAGCSVTDIYARRVLERLLALAEMASQCILDLVTRGNDAVPSYVANVVTRFGPDRRQPESRSCATA